MTQKKWLDKAKEGQASLIALVTEWHPLARTIRTRALPITAYGAEQACNIIRKQIVASKNASNPVERLQAALATDNFREAYRILDQTWFGVPESTDCWQLPGFSLAVRLLEDPPEVDK